MSDLIEQIRALVDMTPGDYRTLAHSSVARVSLQARLTEAADELSRLQSLSDQNRLTGGWRDIESAPKDGATILVWFDRPGIGVRAVHWERPEWSSEPDAGLWHVSDLKHGPFPLRRYCSGDDKFWQPLPSPPLPLPGGEEKR